MIASRLATAIGEADKGMRALARLAEQIGGAPGDDLLAERDEGGDDVAQGHQLGPAAVRAPAC